MPTARLLDLSAALDRSGYHALEVSGGGCFRAAVARGVESPWERIRAYQLRATRTPLAMALRGTFLVGVAARRARPGAPLHPLRRRVGDRHLPAARPAQRRRRPGRARPRPCARPARASTPASSTPTRPGGDDFLVERARRLRALGADRVLLHDPAGRLDRRGVGARDAAARGRRRARRPLLPGAGRHRAGRGRSRRRRAGADPVATAAYPVAVRRTAPSPSSLAQALDGIGVDPGIDRRPAWEAARSIDERARRRLGRCRRVSPHVSLLAALNRVNRPA